MRTPLRLIVLALTSVLAAFAFTVPASAASSPYCGITWGSLAKSAGTTSSPSSTLTGIRAGQHDCYDRLVLDLRGVPAGPVAYDVEYKTLTGVATGTPIPLAGTDLQITLRAHGESLTFADRNHVVNVTGFRTFRQVASAGTYEGVTVLGLGVRARLPFRVFVLDGPAAGQKRLVIDVAHRW
jgi:hypothetical protein